MLVGPDNGLLMAAVRALGGAVAAHEITARHLFLPHVSTTFHGRDVFSPVAAHLANGVPIEEVGRPIDVAGLVDIAFPEPVVGDGRLDTTVLFIDSFGNARLAGAPEDLARALGGLTEGRRVRLTGGAIQGSGVEVGWHTTFGDVAPSEPLLYDDADYDGLAIAINQGSAAERFGLEIDTRVRIEAAGE